MAPTFLEHVNITVSDPAKTAQMLCDLFDWKVRWQGDAIQLHSCGGGKFLHCPLCTNRSRRPGNQQLRNPWRSQSHRRGGKGP